MHMSKDIQLGTGLMIGEEQSFGSMSDGHSSDLNFVALVFPYHAHDPKSILLHRACRLGTLSFSLAKYLCTQDGTYAYKATI
jgi:hypothetical protein